MTTIMLNGPAPDFELLDAYEQRFHLKEHLNRMTLLYFYPKAATSGCTIQARELCDNMTKLQQFNLSVVGISPDAPKKLRHFIEDQGLPYTLLSDPNHTVAEQYGVWVEKSLYGNKYMGVERTSFMVDSDGNIVHILKKTTPKKHVPAILSFLKNAV